MCKKKPSIRQCVDCSKELGFDEYATGGFQVVDE